MHSDNNNQHKGCNIMSNTDQNTARIQALTPFARNYFDQEAQIRTFRKPADEIPAIIEHLLDEIDNGGPRLTVRPGCQLDLGRQLDLRENGLGGGDGNGGAWRVAEILPAGGRLNIFAAPKAGKTTLTGNLVRALVDGQPFLGRYDVDTSNRQAEYGVESPHVLILDTEMTPDQLVDLYGALNVENVYEVATHCYRGAAEQLNLLDTETRAELVEDYGDRDDPFDVVILDPVGPVLAALGLDENSNSDVQRFLTAWDGFVQEIGATESVIVHHAGHNGGRARGASAFHGSGDVNLVLTRGEDAAGTRWVSTTGRTSAELPKSRLGFDPETRRLTLGAESVARAQASRADTVAVEQVTEALAGHPSGLTTTKLIDELQAQGASRDGARDLIARAYQAKAVTRSGSAKAYTYNLPETGPQFAGK